MKKNHEIYIVKIICVHMQILELFRMKNQFILNKNVQFQFKSCSINIRAIYYTDKLV